MNEDPYAAAANEAVKAFGTATPEELERLDSALHAYRHGLTVAGLLPVDGEVAELAARHLAALSGSPRFTSSSAGWQALLAPGARGDVDMAYAAAKKTAGGDEWLLDGIAYARRVLISHHLHEGGGEET